MSKLNKIKEMLQTMLMQFSQLSTDKGLISWDGDGELPAVGDSIVIIDDNDHEFRISPTNKCWGKGFEINDLRLAN